MSSIKLTLFLIIGIQALNLTSFNINFFQERKKLYYVNAMNNENGDIYFEFWGEEDSMRYYIGKNVSTEENLKINGDEMYSIDANTNWNYHESIIVEYNDSINILSINSKNFDYINIDGETVVSQLTTSLVGAHSGDPSYRNGLIKLKNGYYLSSIVLHGFLSHQIYFTIFDLSTNNNINGFIKIKQKSKTIGYMNSTNCFQTESTYIQCSFSNAIPSNNWHVGIYDLNLEEQNTIEFGYLLDYSFTKIFHIKGEIGGYIFFDDRDNNIPKLFLKKLNDYHNDLIDIISTNNYIVLNNNGEYVLDYGLFASDTIKIDDLSFVVVFTIKNTFDLLLCLCDFNINYTGIRIRYYRLSLSSIDIKISVNIRAFNFKGNLGLIFYDSNSKYPGYMIFNHPKITSENKIDNQTITINILVDSSFTTFSFEDHLELINNIYTGKIKIKIINYSPLSSSGVIIKTNTSEISIGDIINFEESIFFEPSNTGAIPGEYYLEFFPFVEEYNSTTELYGNYNDSDFEKIVLLSKEKFILKFIVECYEKCETCNKLGTNINYHCVKCINSFPYSINNGEVCDINCNNFIFVNEYHIITCIEICDDNHFIYKRNEDEKYCLVSCEYNNSVLYQDGTYNICYNDCSEATNGNIFLYFNKCISQCPENYIPDINNICIYKEFGGTEENSIQESLDNSKSESSLLELNETSESKEIIKYSEFIEDSIFYKEKGNSSSIDNNINNFIKISDLYDNIEFECYINIDNLVFDYKRKGVPIEIKELRHCSIIYYCYSANIDIDLLMMINPNLIYIDFNNCKNLLINQNVIDSNSELLIVGKQKITFFNESLINNFNYEIYIINGTKINDNYKSICHDSKIEISSPINENENYDIALSLNEQGYDIFNLSSNFYYDICLSAYLNDSDLTLSIRQNDILPEQNNICLDGCIYNGVNLTTKRISCLCDLDYIEKNKTSKNNNIEEVEDNFFVYILNMINYKIIICHKLLFNFNNYFYNYGLYSGIGILFIIKILCLIYYCIGKKSIKIQYLRHEPKMNENKNIKIFENASKRTSYRNSKDNLIIRNIQKKTNKSRRNNKKPKTFIKKKNSSKLISNPPKNNKRIINNINKKRNTHKQINKIIINMDSDFQFDISKNDNNDSKNIYEYSNNNEPKTENIDYNELTFTQAIIKDERNVIQIFFSYFTNKFDIIQVIFFPKEFSHKSITLSLYLYELLLDLTFNALLFSDDIISQKYYNNGKLLFITSQILSISSNIISCFIVYITSYLVNYYQALETATLEAKNQKQFYQIFINISWFINLKISIFFIIAFISGLFCSYYLFIFCAIFKKIQKNLFLNYLMGTLWSLLYKVGFSIIISILRKIAIYGKFKQLFFISKFIDEKF